jgi:hypothetical protein
MVSIVSFDPILFHLEEGASGINELVGQMFAKRHNSHQSMLANWNNQSKTGDQLDKVLLQMKE